MKSLTVSESLKQMIGGCEVVRAFFTTYNFEPDFFELEILPLLLGQAALSSNETIRYAQLQDLMSRMQGKFAVVYDYDMFMPQLAARLEIDYRGMRIDGACQHAKLVVLELREKNDDGADEHSIVLGAGSFNLSKAGWWENIEAGHWIRLVPGAAPANLHAALGEALAFFDAGDKSGVVADLQATLRQIKPTRADPTCHFYFSGSGGTRLSFAHFIRDNTPKRNRGQLEIVSPYFAEDGDNQHLTAFFKGFETTRAFLPQDEQGNAMIAKEVHDALASAGVLWGSWAQQATKLFELGNGKSQGKQSWRRLHAKVYQHLGAPNWVFVGSVNFSYKAFEQNVEAGFLLLGVATTALLGDDRESPSGFQVEAESGSSDGTNGIAMPLVDLSYDWESARLAARCATRGTLAVFDGPGTELAHFEFDGVEHQRGVHGLVGVADWLARSSLISAKWTAPDGGSSSRTLMVSQRQLYCRPSALPAMSLQDLLAILEGMDRSRRAELIAKLAARMLRLSDLSALGDENTPLIEEDDTPDNFFSMFSQVNSAFWKLRRHLERHASERNYYLKGKQPDSLRGLLDTLAPNDDKYPPPAVVRYLSLLSIQEVLARFAADDSMAAEVGRMLDAVERAPEFSQIPERDKYLAFIRAQFPASAEPNARGNDAEH